jgi:predicted TIM-barrel enzyme
MERTRQDIIRLLSEKAGSGEPIVGVAAGAVAGLERAAGADLIVAYHPGHLGLAGAGSMLGYLAFGNANQAVKEMAPGVVSAAGGRPVLAGVCGTDPYLLESPFLEELRALGVVGVQNFPTVGLIDGPFRKNLEETGISYAREIECIATAHALDLLTAPIVFDPEQATAMIEAGADLLVAHPGLGPADADAFDRLRSIADAARRARPGVLVLRHAGVLAADEDAGRDRRQGPDMAGVFMISRGAGRPDRPGVDSDRGEPSEPRPRGRHPGAADHRPARAPGLPLEAG